MGEQKSGQQSQSAFKCHLWNEDVVHNILDIFPYSYSQPGTVVYLSKWHSRDLLSKEYRLRVHPLAQILLMLPLITVLRVVSRIFLFPMD